MDFSNPKRLKSVLVIAIAHIVEILRLDNAEITDFPITTTYSYEEVTFANSYNRK